MCAAFGRRKLSKLVGQCMSVPASRLRWLQPESWMVFSVLKLYGVQSSPVRSAARRTRGDEEACREIGSGGVRLRSAG